MTEPDSPPEGGTPDATPDYNHIEDLVQDAQDRLADLEGVLDGHRDAIDAIRDALEKVEDRVDDAQDHDDRDRLGNAPAFIQDAQNTVNHLEDQVGFDSATLAEAMDDLEDAIEHIEDAVDDILEGTEQVVVNVSGETFVAEECEMGPVEILQEAGFVMDSYLLYFGADADEDRQDHIEKGTTVDVCEHRQFSAIPDEIGYGGATAEGLPAGLKTEIDDLREDYDVDVETDTGDDHIHVIVRDYPVPSDEYNMTHADVMIRVPPAYPVQAPDWVYVEEDFRTADGELPRKAQTTDTNPNNDAVKDGWVALSWHINKLDGVTWKPYRTDLR